MLSRNVFFANPAFTRPDGATTSSASTTVFFITPCALSCKYAAWEMLRVSVISEVAKMLLRKSKTQSARDKFQACMPSHRTQRHCQQHGHAKQDNEHCSDNQISAPLTVNGGELHGKEARLGLGGGVMRLWRQTVRCKAQKQKQKKSNTTYLGRIHDLLDKGEVGFAKAAMQLKSTCARYRKECRNYCLLASSNDDQRWYANTEAHCKHQPVCTT